MRTPHPPDRLFLLSTFRLALRHNRLTAPEAVLSAPRERLERLAMHRAAIVQLVRQADPDVMLALFLPNEPVDWRVAGSAHDVGLRLLSVESRTSRYSVDVLVNMHYRVDDDGSEERAAWVKLRDALRGVASPPIRE